jgi:dihydroflavonol-4-reductase
MSAKKVWVGGATGFLGSHLAALLTTEGYESVLTSSRGGEAGGNTVSAVDATDAEQVKESATGCDAAFLCIGKVSRDADDAGELHRLHVEGTRAALTGLKEAGVRRVVVASTSGTIAVGTDPDQIFDESAPSPMEHIAAWPYYRTKYFGEQEALAQATDDFDVVIVCPSLLLGPGDHRESSTGDVRKFLEKSIVAVPAGGIAFVDARDAAQGMVLALEKGRSRERYLLNAANMTLSTFFGRLSRISGVSAPFMKLPQNRELARGIFGLYDKGLRAIGGTPPVEAADVEMGQYFWYCSSEKAERELGFRPRDSGQTLRDTVYDLVERQVVAPLEMRK